MNTQNIKTIQIKIFLSLLFPLFLFSFELQKPKTYQNDINVSGWFMSEKLDGIRGYWDGKQMLSKNGNPIYTPDYFTKNFPAFALDGELWSKREDFEFIQNTVLDTIPTDDWKYITYNIFEVPKQNSTFQERLYYAQKWFKNNPNKYVNFIEQIKCKDENHLQSFLDSIISKNGEGVIIKDPTKPYIQGRTAFSLKVKLAQDMEGTVIGYNLNNDKILKSLIIQLPNKIVFNLGGGLSDKERIYPPKIGETITFKYYGLTKNGKPKFASFLRVRKKE